MDPMGDGWELNKPYIENRKYSNFLILNDLEHWSNQKNL